MKKDTHSAKYEKRIKIKYYNKRKIYLTEEIKLSKKDLFFGSIIINGKNKIVIGTRE